MGHYSSCSRCGWSGLRLQTAGCSCRSQLARLQRDSMSPSQPVQKNWWSLIFRYLLWRGAAHHLSNISVKTRQHKRVSSGNVSNCLEISRCQLPRTLNVMWPMTMHPLEFLNFWHKTGNKTLYMTPTNFLTPLKVNSCMQLSKILAHFDQLYTYGWRQWVSNYHFRIWTQGATFETWDHSDIWSEWYLYRKTKRQRYKYKKKQKKTKKTKRWRQNILCCQGSFAIF